MKANIFTLLLGIAASALVGCGTPPQKAASVAPSPKIGPANIGVILSNPRWSQYGVYLKKMIDTELIEWESILEESAIYPNPGSMVNVKFVMNSKGEISKIVHVEGSSGTSGAAQHACVTAITTRAPYGDWTDDMIAALGAEQEMTFTFYYK